MKDCAAETLTVEELKAGHEVYIKNEPRDAMYNIATFLVRHFWNKPANMADSIGVLLLTWNAGFYRFGLLDFNALQICIEQNFATIAMFNGRDITTLSDSDKLTVQQMFANFLLALKRHKYKKSPEAFSPVSVAKTFHLLAPKFFPLWDDAIAKAYGCHWGIDSRNAAAEYWTFVLKTRKVVEHLQGYSEEIRVLSERPILKLVDEYNYSRF